MIGTTNAPGWLGELRLHVVGGEKPAGVNNTVWVHTPEKKLKHLLSPTTPKIVSDGLIWIKTADVGAELYNGNTVYHLNNAFIYSGGRWDAVEAWLYTRQSGWVQFSKYLTPPEYTPVEYIQSTGKQFIITGLAPKTTNWGFEADWSIQNDVTTNNNNDLFGICVAKNNYYAEVHGGGRFYYGNAGTGDLKKLKSKMRQQVQKHLNILTLPDGTTVEIPDTDITYANGISIAVFGSARSISTAGVVTVSDLSSVILYGMKFYNENDALVSDLVPCYRNSDNTAGLWDRMRKLFLPNYGTGIFLVGGDLAW